MGQLFGSESQIDGDLLWQPSDEQKDKANISYYIKWLKDTRGLIFDSYNELWEWSVTDLEGFWASIWEFFEIRSHQPYNEVLKERIMPGAQWFSGALLNYAEHALDSESDHPAIIFRSELYPTTVLTYRDLFKRVRSVATGLRHLGVEKGDRVVAYMPNIPETVVAFLATATIGAIWSSCSPDFGTSSVVERFRQIEPAILIAVDGYQYGGRSFDRRAEVAEIQRQIPSLKHTIFVPYLKQAPIPDTMTKTILWDELKRETTDLVFESVPFHHPLWILYSSGTTGMPKAIVQGHGGILLEHFKTISLHLDIAPNDRFFWFTTTGWMMWNFLISGLLIRSTIILYDGSPAYPEMDTLWEFAQDIGVTYFGTSAAYIDACMQANLRPNEKFNLMNLKGLGSTGAPLPPKGFNWVYDYVNDDMLLGSVSGGTDVCTAFVGSCPLLPVRSGEIQCRCLGAKVEAYDSAGDSLINKVGELVLSEPLPSMPLFFWNDPGDVHLRESYHEAYKGIWRHGDWIMITDRGSSIIYGRSDATLNRGGIRMGTSEFYRVLEELPEVLESLVVDTGQLGDHGYLFLFVVLAQGSVLDDALHGKIKRKIRVELSPRHVPDEIHAIDEIPKTLNGKKLEVPVKRILSGDPIGSIVNRDAIINPNVLSYFTDLAASFSSQDS